MMTVMLMVQDRTDTVRYDTSTDTVQCNIDTVRYGVYRLDIIVYVYNL